jgi:glycosyltransferase involved in cell wall biosynthesis
MFLMQEHLRALGFQSEIFVEHVGAGLEGRVLPHTQYRWSRRDAFIVHHSMGHDLGDWVKGLPRPKLLVYHNVTPAEFFPEGSGTRHYATLGRAMLDDFRPHFDAAIAVSELNAQELRERGYANVSVVPILFDLDELRTSEWALTDRDEASFTILFVGRVSENKRQHEFLEVMRQLERMMERPSRLVLVGDDRTPYGQQLRQRIEDAGLGHRVLVTGKIPRPELLGWYRRADAFLSLSDHEGFGVPLIEAMAFDVPVIAYRSSSIPWTLGGAGVLIEHKDPNEVAALLAVLAGDRALRRALLSGQRRRLREFSSERFRQQLRDVLTRADLRPRLAAAAEPAREPPTWQVEGPFETSYSLAIVNRELASALERAAPGSTALFPTEGPGDYRPDPANLAKLPELEPLWRRGGKSIGARRVIRNLYPPRVHDAHALINVLHFFWEESLVPREWIASFNDHLDLVAAPSRFVKKALRDSGLETPITVVGTGVDHIARIAPEPVAHQLGRGFRFLHVSSAFPRKGVDVLLRAYAQAFTSADDVTLVLKTFPNIHNTVALQLEELRRGEPRFPDVVLMDEDLPAGQILELYRRCHALVAPSRGEGFGLPMAEAMWLGLPVITSAAGGQADFCTDETCWLVGGELAPSRSHVAQRGSLWFEPDLGSLVRALQSVHRATASEREVKVARARERVTRELTWDAVARRLRHSVNVVEGLPAPGSGPLKLAWVSSWNTKCGIATYSEFLLRHIGRDFDLRVFASRRDQPLAQEGDEVRRCWDDRSNPSLEDLLRELDAFGPDVVVFQFNFGFHDVFAFGRALELLQKRGIAVVVTFHSTKDVNKPDFQASLRSISSELATASRLLVHSPADVTLLQSFGLVENVTLFPHGVLSSETVDIHDARKALGLPADAPIVATYGFLLPHKGLEQLVEALPLLQRNVPGTRLLMVNALYPNPESGQQLARLQAAVARLGLGESVTMITDFLSDEETLALLQCAQVVVFSYQQTAESASGAVRIGLASRRPVACTPSEIFDDVRSIVHTLPGFDPASLSRGLTELLGDPDRRASTETAQDAWLKAHDWGVLARRLRGLLRGVVNDRRLDSLLGQSGEEIDLERAASAG